jgi:hypothetical protein
MNSTITDILPPSRRRAIDMDMPSRRKEGTKTYPESTENDEVKKIPQVEYGNEDILPPPKKPTFPYGTVLLTLLILTGCGVILYKFGGAKIHITPTKNQVTIASDLTATPRSGDLPYEIISIDKTAGAPIPSEGNEIANDPAQGTIIISNTQLSPQTLIKNTRFETTDGLIFRIRDSVTIPSGSALSPGTLSVTAYSDTGGDIYNVGPTNFTVPGLKGSKAYTLVSAVSKETMAGGFSGKRPMVKKETRDAQIVKNKIALEKELQGSIDSKVPVGYVLIPGSVFTTYSDVPDSIDTTTVTVSQKATVQAVVFPKEVLAKAIAYKTIGSYQGQGVTFSDFSNLKVTTVSKTAPLGTEPFTFSIAGNATIEWNIDPFKVASAVAGKTRESAQSVISTFPEISAATLLVRPFWKSAFPTDPKSITVSTSSTLQ